MDFEFSEEHKMLREAIKDFVQKEIVPIVDEAEEREEFPVKLFAQMGELGYHCLSYPAEYGAGDMGLIGECIAIEEVAKAAGGIAGALMVQSGIGTEAILAHGTEEQKKKYLIPAIKGQKIAAYGLTEPEAGSDVAAIQTTAVKQGDKYIINGSKIFITNGPICDYIIVAAYTDKSLGANGGISLILVEKGTPGFTSNKMDKFGFRSATTGELYFDNCTVSVANLVGEEGKGFQYLMESLDAGRISHSARSIGIAEAAFESALSYSQERVQFGRPIHKFQAISFKLARMAMDIEAARWLMYRAAWMYDQGARRFKEAAMSKLFASEVCTDVTAEAMQIHGGYALMTDSPVQRYFRDSRFTTITEGTSEIQEIVISRAIGLR